MKLFPIAAVLLAWSCLSQAADEIVVCHYNLRNYMDAAPPGSGQRHGTKAKAEPEMQAITEIVAEIRPDILGVCEMGSPERFAEFQRRLKEAGLSYLDSEYVQAADDHRHLALVSRFPIVARHSQTDLSFELAGELHKVRRGFLDITVQVRPDYRLRLVGVHLKSKLAAPAGEALLRRHEVQVLRRYLEGILNADPSVNLLCYGDFNDTKDQTVFSEVSGVRGTPAFLDDLPAKDALGDRWTHFWAEADVYTRIDYLFASRGLLPEIVKGKAFVYRGPNWLKASDHRAIYASIIPVEK